MKLLHLILLCCIFTSIPNNANASINKEGPVKVPIGGHNMESLKNMLSRSHRADLQFISLNGAKKKKNEKIPNEAFLKIKDILSNHIREVEPRDADVDYGGNCIPGFIFFDEHGTIIGYLLATEISTESKAKARRNFNCRLILPDKKYSELLELIGFKTKSCRQAEKQK